MKTTFGLFALVLAFSTGLSSGPLAPTLNGAWENGDESKRTALIFSDKHFALTAYSPKDRKFLFTYGGSWRLEGGNTLVVTLEFNTQAPEDIGKEIRGKADFGQDKLQLSLLGTAEKFKRLDDGRPGLLAGAWLITGRMNNNALQKITPGARRTMKILSGKRFQWIAYNTETKEFFGTGGGTYTTVNGKYTEVIDFFSRDNTRIGMSLQFDFALENEVWMHKGLSSKGDPIDEAWTKREKIGL